MIKAWIALLGCFLVAALAAAATSDPPPIKVIDRYDHISTGFVLDGRHAEIGCDTCHAKAVFRGTPRTCAACHNNVRARGQDVPPHPHDRCVRKLPYHQGLADRAVRPQRRREQLRQLP
jgi:hypothetical protein